ncbi:Uncharacterised protein [Paucimonas lemoignei]|nr:Uncharacterised protein [Paucimonas lemoignei]
MAYLTYRGPADVVLTIDGVEVDLPRLTVLFQQTHTAVFELMFPDRPERVSCSDVRVTLPSGHVEYGPVTYRNWGVLVFNTGDEWGIPREQSDFQQA